MRTRLATRLDGVAASDFEIEPQSTMRAWMLMLADSTVVDFERMRRIVSAESVQAMRWALEKAGVEFIANGRGAGVRLKRARPH